MLERTIALVTLSLVCIYSLVSMSWAHAATVAALSPDCSAALLKPARASVETLFGSMESAPIVTCLDGPRLGIDVAHGQTRFALGAPAVIVIGPKGQNTNVIAHELAHAELAERVGLVGRELRIPTWFDEGLAMQVDHRAPYAAAALRDFGQRHDLISPAVDVMSSDAFFVEGDQGKFHYALSKCLVSKLRFHKSGWVEQLSALERRRFDALYVEGVDACLIDSPRAR